MLPSLVARLAQVRVPKEVLSGRFDYGFQLGLAHKDVRNATATAKAHFPHATLMPEVERLLAASVDSFGSSADYTMSASHLEQLAGIDLRQKVCTCAGATVEQHAR